MTRQHRKAPLGSVHVPSSGMFLKQGIAKCKHLFYWSVSRPKGILGSNQFRASIIGCQEHNQLDKATFLFHQGKYQKGYFSATYSRKALTSWFRSNQTFARVDSLQERWDLPRERLSCK